MTGSFGDEYADAYDALYSEKDYDAECDVLEQAFSRATRTVQTVLDLGCGTGGHAARLAQRGYVVAGVDLSPGMIATARARATRLALDIDFCLGDIRSVRLGQTFDSVICMFAVLGYQTTDQDVQDALRTVRAHLAPGGPFVFDVWYGPAVLATGPSARVKVVATSDGGEIERRATATLDPSEPVCTVEYELTRRRPGVQDVVTHEQHRMRYFSTEELVDHLDRAGLSLGSVRPLPDTGGPITTSTWNILVSAAG